MNAAKKTVTVVCGCFNEVDNIDEWHKRVTALFEGLPQYELDMIIIDNASSDGTVARLREIAARDHRVKVILNARNFGHIRSPYHALVQARGDAVIVMASDLQDPPEAIPDFLKQWEAGHSSVVGVKEKTADSAIFFFVRRIYYKLVERFAEIQTIQNFTGFGLYDQRVIEICRQINDPYPYFRGLVAEIGLPTAKVPFKQAVRHRGLTKNNLYSLYDLGMLGLTNHSKVPLRLAAMLGFAMSAFSFIVGVIYLVYKLLFWQQFAVGIAPVVIGLFLFSSVQLFFIGVVGEYIGSMHTQIMNRPHVIERERINFPPTVNPSPIIAPVAVERAAH